MKPSPIGAILIVAALAVGTLYGWSRLASEMSSAELLDGGTIGDLPLAIKPHLASPSMIAISAQAAGTPAPDFEARANDGKTYNLRQIVKDGPAVLVFIKDGCPCSLSAEPFLQRIHTAGKGWVPFFGVINGGVDVAAEWVEATHTAMPILADPDLKIIHAYGAENSAYVAFISPGGRIEKLWAGYSEAMLHELAGRMAPWVKTGMETFDATDAPAELYAGCAY